MTPYDIAYTAILTWHVKAEEFDRTLPGEWMKGEYWPAPGIPCEASVAYQKGCETLARRTAAAAGCTRTEWRAACAAAEALTYEDKRTELARMRRAR